MRTQGANDRLGSPDRGQTIRLLAEAQHGVVSRSQLLRAGFRTDFIGRAVRAGRLQVLHRGVYAVGHTALRREGWWMAALLACGEDAVLSHRSAAQLWQLTQGPIRPVEVIAAGGAGRKHRGVVAHRMRLDSGDVLLRANLRTTTPARTIVDLAARLDARGLRRLIERAQDLRRFDPTAVRAVLARRQRAPGCGRLRALVALHQPDEDRARTHLERLFLRLVRAARLPRPHVNVRIAGAERDFAWPVERLVVEVDGYAYHSSRAAKQRDHRRDRELTALGWRPARFTYEDVAFGPEEVAGEVAALLGSPNAPSAARSR